MLKILLNSRSLDLQLFAEGGGGDGGTGASGTSGVSAGVPSQPSGGLESVKYGIQDSTTAQEGTVQEVAEEGTDRNAAFEKLIKGEYKDLYDARVQDTVQRRLKGTKETVDRYNALAPTLEMLGSKYGVDANNIEALNKAIQEDDSYYEDEALEKGVSVEQLKQIKKMERENAELKRQMTARQQKESAEKDVARWMEESVEAKKTYPSLDLGVELKNPQFISLLKSGIDVGTAYFAVHNKELMPQAMQFTARNVEQKLTNKIMSNGMRPAENGLNQTPATVVKSDVSQLSKEDRREIARRVARGEKIRF